jgi:adenosine kinase
VLLHGKAFHHNANHS